jgi:hypothetical protein
MISIFELVRPRFILFGILLQAGYPLFESAAKTGADFKSIVGGAV